MELVLALVKTRVALTILGQPVRPVTLTQGKRNRTRNQ